MKALTVDYISLPALHRRKVAVEIAALGSERLVGRGVYERDRDLGQVLRIKFPSSADGELVLTEQDWSGEILASEASDCDFLIRLS
jgi:hypothetical protein